MNLETDNKIQKKGITLVIPNPCGNIKETKMKNSGVEWIGEIPDDWEVKKVKHSFVRKNEKAMQENPIVLSLARTGVRERDISNNEGQLAESYYNYNPVDVDDLLINPMDLYSGANCSISKVKGVISPAYINLRAKKNVSPVFYDYYFKVQYWMMAFFAHGNGVSFENRWTLNNETLQNYPIVAPSFETQQRIASYLDKKCSKIEETIQNQQQVIEKLKAYKHSLITEAVTGKVKIANGKACGEYESYKDSGVEWIGKIPSEWEVKKLKFSSQIMRGLFSHRPRNDPDYYDGVHPFIQTGEVARAVKYITTYSQTLNELGFSVSREFPAGTVLLTIAANVGDVAILDFNACFPDSVIGFYPKENVSKIFMFYVLKSMKEQFMRNAIISTQMNLNINIVKEEFIPLPSLAEQKEIVKFLEKKSDYIDTAIEQKQNLIEKLTEYKKSLIYECVTGKKEI